MAISLHKSLIPDPFPGKATQEMEEQLIWMLVAISLHKSLIPVPIPGLTTQEMEEQLIW